MPEAALANSEGPPDGLRAFLSAIRGSSRATLSLVPRGDAFQAELTVSCKSGQQAEEIAGHLEKLTDLLRKSLVRAKLEPNPRDLADVLSEGSFRRKDTTVHGAWPIERVFLELLAEGNI
jgi:hypothetical protein